MFKKVYFLFLSMLIIMLVSCNNQTITQDSNSKLSNIVVNDKYLDNFNQDVLEYEITISYTDIIEVKGIAASSKAVVSGNTIKEDIVGNSSYDFSLICIAEDQSKTTYSLKVNVLEEESFHLEAIYIDGSLLTDFNKDKTDYVYKINEAKTVNINAISNNSNVVITGIGNVLVDDNTKVEITLTLGEKKKVYNILFTYDETLITPYLSEISVNGTILSDFKEDKFSYTYNLGDTLNVKVDAKAKDSYLIAGLGDYEVIKGSNLEVIIKVSYNDLVTEYKILFITNSLDSDTSIKELRINGDLVDLNSMTYYLYDTKVFTITAILNSDSASITGIGQKTLSKNDEVFILTVKAEDNTTKNYNLRVIYQETSGVKISYIAGLNESIALSYEGSNNLTVSYKLKDDTTWQEVHKELIRTTNNITRVDILGLKEGIYDVKVGNVIKESINVYPYDRSGYAFFNNQNMGAYNSDGTLKDNALVIYVNDSNKNSVEAKINNKTYKGLVNILQNVKNSKVPVVVRIIGKINAAMWNEINYSNYGDSLKANDVLGINNKPLTDLLNGDKIDASTIIEKGYNLMSDDIANNISVLEGLTNRINYDSKNNEFDSYYNMIDISNANNLTIEGVGTDATINQFGFTFKKSSYIEVRNLTFTNNPEDACSFEGDTKNPTLYGYYFVHHNTFNRGYNSWDVCGEQDKHEGDGSCDIKGVGNVTLAYNVFNNTHKTSLVGGSDDHIQYNLTYHHNYFNECESRLPLARQANIHMYNNYFYKISNSSTDLRAGAYAFLENNYFEESKLPKVRPLAEETKVNRKASIKSYNNYVDEKSKLPDSDMLWQVVNSRTASVTCDCLIIDTSYNNFDVNSDLFYYKNNRSDVTLLNEVSEVKELVSKYAGVLKENMLDTIFS